MSYEDFIDALDELYMSIEEVAEKLGLEVDDVKAWEESDDEIPDSAVDLIKTERENRAADQIETDE
ncbi:MAG: hypothetical protein CBD16_09275 [Betaproteobacteria bacterium TMED156]|nr:MAG: hypothetical protein CBD16_09275 [Betaproteobacteria bacterium TMED156]|tara:strand:- start:195 stop:392 length:198 start_codon:yes stop_codon:yes gene_type:complete